MSVLFLVLPLAVVFSGLAVLAFLWATRKGQFDDLATPALRMLRDDAGAVSSGEPPGLERRKNCSRPGDPVDGAQALRPGAAPHS